MWLEGAWRGGGGGGGGVESNEVRDEVKWQPLPSIKESHGDPFIKHYGFYLKTFLNTSNLRSHSLVFPHGVTDRMKQFFTFLLLCLVTAHAVADLTEEDCKQPYKVFIKWAENSCAMGKVEDFVNEFGFGDQISGDQLKDFAQEYCTKIKPQIHTCFDNLIENCPNKDRLTNFADMTSSICSPGANSTAVRVDVLQFINKHFPGDMTGCELDLSGAIMFQPDREDLHNKTFAEYKDLAEDRFLLEALDVIKKGYSHEANCAGWKLDTLKRLVYDSSKYRPQPYAVDLNVGLIDLLLSGPPCGQ
ncbi:hypothetical protein ACOMHN_060202 [Nucella lapillus]